MSENKQGYGLIEEIEKRDTDYLAGKDNKVNKPILAKDGNHTQDLPTGESQKHKYHDDWACVIRSMLNVNETIFNSKIRQKMFSVSLIKWLQDNNYFDENGKIDFDDFFIAKIAKTKCKVGNRYSTVADTARHYGLTPQKKRPEIRTCEAYYRQEITEEEYALGREFKKRVKLNYELVCMRNGATPANMQVVVNNVYKTACLQESVNAWHINKLGLYFNPTNKHNHAVEGYRPPIKHNFAFDSYAEKDNTPYIKKLTYNYYFGYWAYAWYANEIIQKPMLELYKDFKTSCVYVMGVDKKFYPISEEKIVFALFGDWKGLVVHNLNRPLDKHEIGETIYFKNTFIQKITDLFSGIFKK